MKQKKLLFLVLIALGLVISCSKDEGPTTPANTAPKITNATKTFTVSESVNDTFVIGTVTATDADKDDKLTFAIDTNSDNLFEISGTGAISLAAGKTLSFATKSSHVLGISVSDGKASAKANFTINVTQAVATNESPVIGPQGLSAAEDLQGGAEVGTVAATDADGDALSFSMTDASGIFAMDPATGKISLTEGETLDFETTAEYTVSVSVADGKGGTDSQDITISVTDVNEAPVFDSSTLSFEVEENSQSQDIGTILANDPENDTLVFTLTNNSGGLFAISQNGELSLTVEPLNYESKQEHILTVEVTDNTTDPVTEEITITVLNVIETLAEDPASFVTTWHPTATYNLTVRFRVDPQYTYDFTVDWGDDTVEQIQNSDFIDGGQLGFYFGHTYGAEGDYTVAINGVFPHFNMEFEDGEYLMMTSMDQWGSIAWKSMRLAFANCFNMVYNATDEPDLSQVSDMYYMFFNAGNFNADLSSWNTSNVTTMEGMFGAAASFDQDLGAWDISSVTSMFQMLDVSGLSSENYSATLSGWANSNAPQNITLGAVGLQHCNTQAISAAITYLTGVKGWTIIDDGIDANCN